MNYSVFGMIIVHIPADMMYQSQNCHFVLDNQTHKIDTSLFTLNHNNEQARKEKKKPKTSKLKQNRNVAKQGKLNTGLLNPPKLLHMRRLVNVNEPRPANRYLLPRRIEFYLM